MSDDLTKYRIWCNDENEFVITDYLDHEPTGCPNSAVHDIDVTKTEILDVFVFPGPTTTDGKPRMQVTPRPLGTKTCFTSFADARVSSKDIGGGTPFEFVHNIGDPLIQSLYMDLNAMIEFNTTWVYCGSCSYLNAKRDRLTVDMVSSVVNFTTSEVETDYRAYGGIVLPNIMGVGDWINIPSIVNGEKPDTTYELVYAPNNDLGEAPTAYWNADWDQANHKFINITPAPTGDGRYNMFTEEKTFVRFIDVLLLGTHYQDFKSSDVDCLGHGIRFKITVETRGTDHDWEMVGQMSLFREKTI